MAAAERHRKLIADLEAKSTWLREAEVVRLAWMAAADETGLRGNEAKMRLIPAALWLGEGEGALVDLSGDREGR